MSLAEAFEYEAKEVMPDIEDMMKSMLENVQDAGEYVPFELDETMIRKLLLAREYLKRDIDKMENLKASIMKEWDQRIERKNKEIDRIEDLLEYYVREKNHGKSISLDVGTVSLRKKPHSVKVKDKVAARQYLQEKGCLEAFLKPAELDVTLLQKSFLNELEMRVQKVADQRIQEEQDKVGKPLTKKRQKEIYEETLNDLMHSFVQQLPDFVEFHYPSDSLTIRSNWK